MRYTNYEKCLKKENNLHNRLNKTVLINLNNALLCSGFSCQLAPMTRKGIKWRTVDRNKSNGYELGI